MKNQTNSRHNETKQATFRPTRRKSTVSFPLAVQSPAAQQNPSLITFPPQGPPPQLVQGEREWGAGNSMRISFLHPHPSPILSKAQCLPPTHPEALTPAPTAPPAAPHSRVDDGHEMHQPQHQEEDEPEDGHSLQGQVQERHPPAWPGPLRPPPRTALPQEDRVGARRGGAVGERKVGRGRGGGGWGRKGRAGPARPARAHSFALCPGRARCCGRCGGRAPWSERPWPALRLASPHPRGRRPDTARLRPRCQRPAASPPGPGPHNSAPCSAAAAPRTNRNRQPALRLSGAPRPAPAPALRNGGARPSKGWCATLLPAHPAALAPAASPSPSPSGARPWEASAGREPAFPAGSCLPPRLTLGVGRRRPGRPGVPSWAGLPRRWRHVTLCPARRLLALCRAPVFPSAPEKHTEFQAAARVVSKSSFQSCVCSFSARHCSEGLRPSSRPRSWALGCPIAFLPHCF